MEVQIIYSLEVAYQGFFWVFDKLMEWPILHIPQGPGGEIYSFIRVFISQYSLELVINPLVFLEKYTCIY